MVRLCRSIASVFAALACAIGIAFAGSHEGALRPSREVTTSQVSLTRLGDPLSTAFGRDFKKDFMKKVRQKQPEEKNDAERYPKHVLEHGNGTAVVDMRSCDFGNASWALFVDGKDAEHGPEAYGKDFVESVLRVWDDLQHDRSELDVQKVLSMQSRACPHHPVRDRIGVMGELFLCTQDLPSAFLEQLLQDLPEDVVGVHRSASGRINSMYAKTLGSDEVLHHLHEIVDTYKADLASKQHKRAIAILLRSLAWLHPFSNCNGRLRTLLLQRELRYLHLACGASMYNNNADIYFETTDTYERKMEEGLGMARLALQSGKNPWNHQSQEQHRAAFPIHQALQRECAPMFEHNAKSIS